MKIDDMVEKAERDLLANELYKAWLVRINFGLAGDVKFEEIAEAADAFIAAQRTG